MSQPTADVEEFTVTAGTISVTVATAGSSWGFYCGDDGCTARLVLGYDTGAGAAGGAAHHLRWHASGCRVCKHCDGLLAPEDQPDECAPGDCPVRDDRW